MRSFIPLALLANAAFSCAAAIPKRGLISDLTSDILSVLGVLTGSNAQSSSAGQAAWFGNDGDYVTEFSNTAGEDVTIVLWGPTGSWVNVNMPLITHTLTNGSSVNISVTSGTSGGFAAIYNDTQLLNGQVSNTWGEFTYNGEFSTFDVSRLPKMSGRNMSIEVPECVSNMETCVFTCDSGDTCMTGYSLENCSSQKGAESGTFAGAASGGCLVGSDNNFIKAVFS